MSNRLRLSLILIGALLVVLTYTFPVWQPLLQREERDESFPGLVEDLQPAYLELPAREQRLYLTMRQEDPQMAVDMLTTALTGNVEVSEENQTRPSIDTAVVIRRGSFIDIDPFAEENALLSDFFPPSDEISPYLLDDLWTAEGDITIYRYPDNSKLVWLSEFVVSPGPNLRIALARDSIPLTFEELGADYLIDRPLFGNIGAQGFIIGADQDITDYRSIVIFDATYNVIFGVAPIG